jgi:BTB/POZ domain
MTRDKRKSLYLEDGNIVLSASQNDGGYSLFRVHKSILAKNSPVFSDMFTLSTPDSADIYDGVPIVQLHDDPKDLEQFLEFLYYPRYLI